MTAITPIDTGKGRERPLPILDRQRAAFLRDGPPSLAERRRDLKKLKKAILAREEAFVAALDHDFGHRSRQETMLFDIGSTVGAINYLHSNVARWMRPEPRGVAMVFLPGSNRVIYQPLGVIGIVSPWNYPIGLALIPLATALAAGNRAMLKPSEFAPATTGLIASMIAETLRRGSGRRGHRRREGGRSSSRALPFDHLLFTGSIPVGKSIMRAATENLVPVTLELGGKSPVIVERGFSLATAAHRIAFGKLANGGQTCVAPDYALVPEEETEAFVAAFETGADKLYPEHRDEPRLHLDHQRPSFRAAERPRGRRQGQGRARDRDRREAARRRRPAIAPVPAGAPARRDRRDGGDAGGDLRADPARSSPIASSKTPSPTSMRGRGRSRSIIFGPDGPGRRLVLERTTSGNVTVNDTNLHYAQEDLPFGGVGASGMGAYHAPEGFKTMSHAKGVFHAGEGQRDRPVPPALRANRSTFS